MDAAGGRRVVLVMLFGLASCTVGPDYVRPTAPMQETFKEMAGWKQAEPKEDLLRGKWWEIFTNSELSALEDAGRYHEPEHRDCRGELPPGRRPGRGSPGLLFPYGEY